MTNPEELPALDGLFSLSEEAVAGFARDGHVLVRSLASPEEVAAYQPVISGAACAHSLETRPLAERNTYGKAFLQVTNLWETDEEVAQFVRAPRFANVAARLLGAGGARLYHDQALFKEAGGGITPWHQDAIYWPFDADTGTITMWMPLVDLDQDMGGMDFATGSYRAGSLSDITISDESQEYYDNVMADGRFEVTTAVPMRAGDATFHAGWTLHRAHPNTTSVTREVMTVIYFADGARVAQPHNSNQEVDRRRWLSGAAPGEPAAGPLNPLLSN